MSDYNQLDKAALDRYLTRDDDSIRDPDPDEDEPMALYYEDAPADPEGAQTWIITIRVNDVHFARASEYYGPDPLPQVGLALSDANFSHDELGDEGEIVITYRRKDAK